ncbi:MAG TPA: hypothetical protein VLA05_05010 [Coriobacteriia bacterium]|nr:hypothetical protein [Coriobacteriia bacterium]
MRKVRMGALVAVAAVGLSATFVSQAGAFPSRTSPCAGCHDGANIPITATATSNNGANATYNLSAPGADYIAVFNGSTKVTQITGSSGSITVATGNTYTLNSVAGPSTSDGLGTLSISPAGAPADTTAPVTTSNAAASYVSMAAIALSATDAGSGVAATYYKLDGGAQVAGTAVVTSALGSHTLQFWSVDKAGNIEAAKTANFTVTAPVPEPPSSGLTTSTVSIKSSNWRISRNRSATLSGELTPASGGEVVALYVMKPGSNEWQLLSTRNTNLLNDRDDDEYDDDDDEREYSIDAVTQSAEASWSYRFSSRTRGTYQFQVRFAGDADSTAAVSRTVSISVR